MANVLVIAPKIVDVSVIYGNSELFAQFSFSIFYNSSMFTIIP
jgi:hypothetical protein